MDEFILNYIEEHKGDFTKLSHDIWDNPEIAFNETYACEKTAELLKQNGFEITKNVANLSTAFVAEYGSGKPVIAFLAEYDALPMLSQKAAETQSAPVCENGPGHGCGHNALGAGCVGAAVALKNYMMQNSLSGTVRLYGCPAEENGCGKMHMVKAGAFSDVDIALTWHPDTKTAPMTMTQLANASYIFSFEGKSSHAAMAPENGRSALDACELMNVGANYMREHIKSSARMHYAYLDVGGSAPNVVQSTAALNYFVRSPKLCDVNHIVKRLINVAKGAALMTETTLKVQEAFVMNDFVVNHTVAKVIGEALKFAGGPAFDDGDRELAQKFNALFTKTQVQSDLNDLKLYLKNQNENENTNGTELEEYEKSALIEDVFGYKKIDYCKFGSSDVGNVSYEVPTGWLSVATLAFGTPLHHYFATAQTKTSMADKALLCAAKVLALTGAKFLTDETLLNSAKQEMRTNGELDND